MTGHLLGAAGRLEAGLAVLALRDRVAPPTTNVREVDDACRFRLVRDKALRTTLEHAMTNSFCFGGTNASLIFRAPTDAASTGTPTGESAPQAALPRLCRCPESVQGKR